MRIFLLPISTRQALVYCQQIAAKPAAKLSIIDRVQKKAVDTWASWETADKGWKKKVVDYGNKGLQRIPYQEWGLKSFPPSTPDLQAEQVTDGHRFSVIYPGNVMQKEDVPKVMARLARERKTLHWNRFIGSMIAMPFTIPFALIPIIPNIPFFYMVYRCWSHWRALKGSDHLDFILDHKLFKAHSTKEIENMYQQVAPKMLQSFSFVTRTQVEENSVPEEKMLLPTGSHTLIAKSLDVPALATEVERAVWQVQQQLKKEAAQQEAHPEKVKLPASSEKVTSEVAQAGPLIISRRKSLRDLDEAYEYTVKRCCRKKHKE